MVAVVGLLCLLLLAFHRRIGIEVNSIECRTTRYFIVLGLQAHLHVRGAFNLARFRLRVPLNHVEVQPAHHLLFFYFLQI